MLLLLQFAKWSKCNALHGSCTSSTHTLTRQSNMATSIAANVNCYHNLHLFCKKRKWRWVVFCVVLQRESLFLSFPLSFSAVALGGSLNQIGRVGSRASSRSPLPFTSVAVLEILLAIEFFLRLGVKGKCFRFSVSLMEMQILILWFHSVALSQLHAQLKVFLSPVSLRFIFSFVSFLIFFFCLNRLEFMGLRPRLCGVPFNCA